MHKLMITLLIGVLLAMRSVDAAGPGNVVLSRSGCDRPVPAACLSCTAALAMGSRPTDRRIDNLK